MDVVIPLADEPRNLFIDHALASVKENAPWLNPVIVGHTSPYLSDPRIRLLVPTMQTPNNAFKNTNLGMITACRNEAISDPFIWAADDIFWRWPVTFDDVDYFGSIANQKLRSYEDRGLHGRYFHETATTLEGHDLSTWSYERHVPLVIYKKQMLKALDLGVGAKRSLYMNLRRKNPIDVQSDVKVWKVEDVFPATEHSPFLSVGPKFPVDQLFVKA